MQHGTCLPGCLGCQSEPEQESLPHKEPCGNWEGLGQHEVVQPPPCEGVWKWKPVCFSSSWGWTTRSHVSCMSFPSKSMAFLKDHRCIKFSLGTQDKLREALTQSVFQEWRIIRKDGKTYRLCHGTSPLPQTLGHWCQQDIQSRLPKLVWLPTAAGLSQQRISYTPTCLQACE